MFSNLLLMRRILFTCITLFLFILACTNSESTTNGQKKTGEENALVERYLQEMVPTERTQDDIDRNLIINLLIDSLWDFKRTESGIYYDIQETGVGGSPRINSNIKAHYRGTLLSGKEFDSSYKKNRPMEIQLSQVVAGWQEALPMLQKGGKGTFIIPSRLAYGPQAFGNIIPANSCLIFEMELLDFD